MLSAANNVVPWGPWERTQISSCDGGVQGSTKSRSGRPDDAEASATPPDGENSRTGRRSALLDLPLEIRLQIYSWVHRASPIRKPELAPWLPNPSHKAYFVEAVASSDGDDDADDVEEGDDPAAAVAEDPQLLSPHRPVSRIPTALLRSCRQMYTEARDLPFWENEFVFVNWFSSGVATARAFAGGLQAWQRDGLRYARLEVRGVDLYGAGVDRWAMLCGLLARGLRGLRLKMVVRKDLLPPVGEARGGVVPGEQARSLEMPAVAGEGDGVMAVTTMAGDGRRWFDEGLVRLRALRQLEVELVDSSWADGEKLAWCAGLDAKLNSGPLRGMEQRVRVLCVEKAGSRAERLRNAPREKAGEDVSS